MARDDPQTDHVDVLIIGAGMSGVDAAYRIQTLSKADLPIDAELARGLLDIVADRISFRDRHFARPRPEREAKRVHVGIRPHAGIAEQVPGAADALAHVEQGKYAEAYKLWSDGGKATGETAGQFAKSFEAYREIHANIGGPGDMEGAAGSSYVDYPVQLYGRTKDGKEFNSRGTMALRRINDVPGSTAEQRSWHIYKSDFPGQK
jgi:hypothetical protein